MSRKGRPRRELILRLCPADVLVIDVGADHGQVAAALPRAIATERQPHLARTHGLRWVVADGLDPFREVECAVIAGMGARTIAGILARPPRPRVAVVHATDDPPLLRTLLAADGWRMDAEGLAPEAGRFAEVIRVVPGQEQATGPRLELGPRLLQSDDPLLVPHLTQLLGHYRHTLSQISQHAPDKAAVLTARIALIVAVLAARGAPVA